MSADGEWLRRQSEAKAEREERGSQARRRMVDRLAEDMDYKPEQHRIPDDGGCYSHDHDTDRLFGDDEPHGLDNAPCPMCNGQGTLIGGQWLRCRQCGIDYRTEAMTTPEGE